MKSRFLVFALVAAMVPAMVCAGSASAATTTKKLDFTELSMRPLNGVHINGVKFAFSVGGAPSTDATYGGVGPGTTKYVSDPSATGPTTGTLTITFDRPTSLLQFGVALDVPARLSPGFTVKLFDTHGASLGTFPVRTTTPVSFSEARFTKKGLAVKKAQITFAAARADAFAFDNLVYKG